jgi:hypothetical protein
MRLEQATLLGELHVMPTNIEIASVLYYKNMNIVNADVNDDR